MTHRLAVALTLALALTIPLMGTASAQELHLDLPPGIAKQAEPLMMDMMAHMAEMEVSEEQMAMMMEEMQMMADQLPPGIFLQLLKLMSQLDMPAMMEVHDAVRNDDLLQQPPGQVLRFVRDSVG